MTKIEEECDAAPIVIRPAALPVDAAKYRSELDCFDITEAQKQELLMTLWSIMRSFVELGFNVDVCGVVLNEFTPVPDQDEQS